MIGALAAVPARRLVAVLAVTLVLLNLGGWYHLQTGQLGRTLNIDLDPQFSWPLWQSRINIPSLANALVLTAAGVALFRLGRRYRLGRFPAVAVIGGCLVFMALDEFFAIHEQLAHATGIHWQLLYLPVFALIGTAGAALVLQAWRAGLRPPLVMFVAGGLCWVLAQVLENLQFDSNHVKVPATGLTSSSRSSWSSPGPACSCWRRCPPGVCWPGAVMQRSTPRRCWHRRVGEDAWPLRLEQRLRQVPSARVVAVT